MGVPECSHCGLILVVSKVIYYLYDNSHRICEMIFLLYVVLQQPGKLEQLRKVWIDSKVSLQERGAQVTQHARNQLTSCLCLPSTEQGF